MQARREAGLGAEGAAALMADYRGPQQVVFACWGGLPDGAAFCRSHWLTRFTAEGLLKFRQVHNNSVDTKFFRRVRICLHEHAQKLWTIVFTPALSVGDEELLFRS